MAQNDKIDNSLPKMKKNILSASRSIFMLCEPQKRNFHGYNLTFQVPIPGPGSLGGNFAMPQKMRIPYQKGNFVYQNGILAF